MREFLVGVLMSAVASSIVTAQGDPDKLVKDGGVTVKGWHGRLDPSAEAEGKKITDAAFLPMSDGMHVTSGPAAIYWSNDNRAKGSYTAKATFTQTKAPMHLEFYGMFIGGTDLQGAKPNYLYCLVTGAGVFLVKHRVGGEVHDLAARTEHAAIIKGDAKGQATNEIAWDVTPERTSCVVNGKEVWSYASKDLIGPGKLETLDGIAGIRVNHNLDVHVSGFAVTKE